MSPRWLWLNHIPAGLDLTDDQRAEVARLLRTMGPGQRRFSAILRRMLVRLLPSILLITLMFCVWLLWLIRSRPGFSGWMIVYHVLAIVLFQQLIWVAIVWSINRAIAPQVWCALNHIGVRVCEGCGYIMQYLPIDADRCPECGAAVNQSPPVETSSRGQP